MIEAPSLSAVAAPERPIPLENGERLNASEFLRRYDEMPETQKAELVQGTVYIMASPVSINHGEPDSLVQTWLGVFASRIKGIRPSTNVTTKLGPEDVPQPDATLRILPEYGGQTRIVNGIIHGAPELGVEIAMSSSSIDANAKKASYLRADMKEYLLWRTRENRIDWWELVDDAYKPIKADKDGILRSKTFPGLWLDREAMLAGDAAKVLDTLNQGLASEEHTAFVNALDKRDC